MASPTKWPKSSGTILLHSHDMSIGCKDFFLSDISMFLPGKLSYFVFQILVHSRILSYCDRRDCTILICQKTKQNKTKQKRKKQNKQKQKQSCPREEPLFLWSSEYTFFFFGNRSHKFNKAAKFVECMLIGETHIVESSPSVDMIDPISHCIFSYPLPISLKMVISLCGTDTVGNRASTQKSLTHSELLLQKNDLGIKRTH